MVEGVNLDDFLKALKADGVDYGGRFVCKILIMSPTVMIYMFSLLPDCPKGHLYYIGDVSLLTLSATCTTMV